MRSTTIALLIVTVFGTASSLSCTVDADGTETCSGSPTPGISHLQVASHNSQTTNVEAKRSAACKVKCDALSKIKTKTPTVFNGSTSGGIHHFAWDNPEDVLGEPRCDSRCYDNCECIHLFAEKYWEEACHHNSCSTCDQCASVPFFAVEADYVFKPVCIGQEPVEPDCGEAHLSTGENKLPAGGCGNDDAKDIVIEYVNNECGGPAVALVTTCYEHTDYDSTIAVFTMNNGLVNLASCNDDVGDPAYCHEIEKTIAIPERYLVNGKYVSCPAQSAGVTGAHHENYGDGKSGLGVRCSANGIDMEEGQVVRIVVSSYNTGEGNFKICNRLHDVW